MTAPGDPGPLVLMEEIFPGDTNAYGTAFGGKILALMDRAAGLVTSRYAHLHFVTASLGAMHFSGPVQQGEIAEVEATVIYTSRHTCGVRVCVFAVDKTRWERRACGQGTFFMVPKGPAGEILKVPALSVSDEAGRLAWADAARIHQSLRERAQKPKGTGC